MRRIIVRPSFPLLYQADIETEGEPSIKLFGEVKALSDQLKAGQALTQDEEDDMLSVDVDKWLEGFVKDTASEKSAD